LGTPDVDISLHPSREIPIAGELWSVAAEIYNRWTSPVWIVDSTTSLLLAPEMWGQATQKGSIGAFFPTVHSRPTSEVVRIDPGAKYSVVWKLDPMSEKGKPGADSSIRSRIYNSIRNFAFFNPGTFRVSGVVHIWGKAPTFDNGRVSNLGDSYCMSVSRQITMESSPWVLILGAAAGGILCFILQALFGNVVFGSTVLSGGRTLLLGLSSAIILSGVVTVLVSRLATTDFLVVVKVKDIWGSIATGFAIQWFGYDVLTQLLSRVAGQ
jgi:hypothetical protein